MLAEVNIEPCTFSVSSFVEAMKYAWRMHAHSYCIHLQHSLDAMPEFLMSGLLKTINIWNQKFL